MPKGPPPYPVAFKEFFITDPKTGKQTMKVQMFPSDKKNEIDGDDDDNEVDLEHDPDFWVDFLDNYRQVMPHYDQYYRQDDSYEHGVLEDEHHEHIPIYEHHEAPMHGGAMIESYPERWTHMEPGFDHHSATQHEDDHQFGYLVHPTPLQSGDHDVYLGMQESHEHEYPMRGHLQDAHDRRRALMEHLPVGQAEHHEQL